MDLTDEVGALQFLVKLYWKTEDEEDKDAKAASEKNYYRTIL